MRHLVALGALFALAPAAGALAQQTAANATAPAATAPAPAATAANAPANADDPNLTPAQRSLNVCRACHTLNQGERTLIGPNLHGIFGRRAGAVEGYRYSVNMRALAETGHVWNEENIRRWLSNPQAMVPRTAMKFPGFPDQAQINELLPLLKEVTGG